MPYGASENISCIYRGIFRDNALRSASHEEKLRVLGN
jgi:hypothetical protein